MKTIDVIMRIFKFALIILVVGFFMQRVTAQSKKDTPVKKKTRVEIKITKEDDKGNVVRIDTAYEVNEDVSTKAILKKIDSEKLSKGEKNKSREISVTMTADDMDSLSKEIEATVMMDEDLPPVPGFLEMNDEMIPPPGPDDHNFMWKMNPGEMQENNPGFPWGMGMTPWGTIKKFEIKNKKHGKRITIETNDDGMMFMPPPVPPVPPAPPLFRQEKQVRIEKDDGSKPGIEKVIILKKNKKGDTDRNE